MTDGRVPCHSMTMSLVIVLMCALFAAFSAFAAHRLVDSGSSYSSPVAFTAVLAFFGALAVLLRAIPTPVCVDSRGTEK